MKIRSKAIQVLSMLFLSVLVVACNSTSKEETSEESTYVALDKLNIENLEKEISKREKAVNEDSTGVDGQNAAELMEAYGVFAERFPNRANSADRLFMAGELAMSLNHTTESIKYFEKVYNNYQDYEKRPYALFLKAFVLENQAKQYDLAKEIYQEFIELYPNHPMADDAQYSVLNMGKSPEELIREFERKDSIRAAQETAS